ncbi:MAG: rRNA maturation RNase YbeY [Actinomycetota bacterium]|nr:rRNA maturation RNase YbeY [Actinomycetota bacterium]
MPVFLADEQDSDVDVDDLVALAHRVLAERRVPADMEVALLLVDEDTIAGLNLQHLGHEGPTDVLAFPMDEPGESPPAGPAILGDVVICPAVAHRQATERGIAIHAELQLLTVHGLLHLLGMDHAEPDEEREMFALTDRLLALHRDEVGRP